MIRRLIAVARNTYLESVRQKLFVSLLVFGFLLMASALILKDISIQQDAKILMDVGLASIEFFGSLVAIFIGADIVSRDIERRTVHLLLVKPLSRTEFVIGRFLGLGATLLSCVGLMAIGLVLALATVRAAPRVAVLTALVAMAMQLLVSGAIATCLSALASRPLAMIGATILCLLGRMSDVLKNVSVVIEGFPDWLGKTVYYTVPNLRAFDLKTRAVYGDAIPATLLVELALYALTYCGVLLALATLAFERRDLK
jgi:Cu-processing system permease protein